MNREWLSYVLGAGILWSSGSFGASLADAEQAAAVGDYAQAATAYRSASDSTSDPATRLSALWGLSDADRQLGKNRAALDALDIAATLARSPEAKALTTLRRGDVLYGLGRYDEAVAALQEVQTQQAVLPPSARAVLLLNLGNVAIELDELKNATAYFDQAAQAAQVAGDSTLQSRALINALRAQLDDKELGQVDKRLAMIQSLLATLPANAARAQLEVALGNLYTRAVDEFGFPSRMRADALAAYQRALGATNDPANTAYAYGFMSALYEDEGRYDEALRLARRAVFAAQQAELDEQTYRWEWQIGRILRAQGDLVGADAAYQRAVFTLSDKVKPNLVAGSRNTYQRLVAPVYTQYADVMLLRAAAMEPGEQKQQLLKLVRELLEEQKKAEVEDYFANQCLVRNQIEGMPSLTDGDAAVIYPIFLEHRIEVLVEARNELAQFTVPVGSNQATQTIRRFRVNLERATAGDAYLADAKQLYQWLLAPSKSFLTTHDVKTLVVVPEGPLRTIPVSALHDGKQFLVERFAIATTPAIKLTQRLQNPKLENLLIGGISEGVQGFDELPSVKQEIDTVSGVYPGVALREAAFRTQEVTNELGSPQFTLAHFATHGEFNHDYRKSFILTYDDKITMGGLQQALEKRGSGDPLDLLVLSACKTAAGDDRAALGLAGVAVQSGANSALASLWSISDAATAELISKFYAELKQQDVGKAESLRQAQLGLLHGDRFSHPSYWAPYLLIGNWL